MKTITKSILASLAGFLILLSANAYAGTSAKAAKTENTTDTATHKTQFCFLFGTILRQINVTCYGGTNGAVGIVAAFGTKPYSFTWSPAVTNSNALIDSIDGAINMAAGTYTCTISDAAGCTYNVIVTITQPNPVTVTTAKQINETCNGGMNGVAVVNTTGGTPFKNPPPYRYAWNPNVSTTDTIKNVAAGTYIVTVTDSNRCTGSDTITISQPAPMSISSKVTSSSCTGANGTAMVMVTAGGTKPYMYSWNTGATIDSIGGLAAASYTCMITDSNKCKDSASVIVTDSTTLAVSLINQANEKCYGNSVGLAAYSVSGGKGTVTYNWAPTGGAATSAAGLSAGTYTFTATDSVGCKAIGVVNITQPAPLHDSMTVRKVACLGGTTGRSSVIVTGGTGPYSYMWSTGATTSNITNIAAGTYSVMVTDNNGCMDSSTVSVTQPATAVADSNTVINLTCYDGNNGSIFIHAFGGTPPYTFRWPAPSTNTSDSASGLSAGTYIVRVRDSNRCTIHDTIIVTQPPTFIVKNDTTMIGSNPCGSAAWVQLVGTMSKYTFSWSSGQTTDTAKNLCNGTYYVSITDSNGCTIVDTIVINNPTGINAITYDPGVKVFPVPTSSKLNVMISDNNFGLEGINVYDMTGREIMNQKVSANTNRFMLDVSKLAEGTYFLKLTGSSVKLIRFTVAGK